MTRESFLRKERRVDNESWPRVRAVMATGITLWAPTDVSRFYLHIGAVGGSLSRRRVRKLEREGVLRRIGTGRYELAEGR